MPYITGSDNTLSFEFQDGSRSPVVLLASTQSGALMVLSDEQVTALQQINLPDTFPLPDAQISTLRNVTVSNVPTEIEVANFPDAFSVSNLPAEFPLPASQQNAIANILNKLNAQTYGAGEVTPGTLRVAVADRPISVIRTSVPAQNAERLVASANPSRRYLSMFNDGNSSIRIGLGSSAVSAADFSFLLRAGDYMVLEAIEAPLEVRALWETIDGFLRVTEGI